MDLSKLKPFIKAASQSINPNLSGMGDTLSQYVDPAAKQESVDEIVHDRNIDTSGNKEDSKDEADQLFEQVMPELDEPPKEEAKSHFGKAGSVSVWDVLVKKIK